eukprot:10071974-Alexandrium_andersonii.AAC.1
MPAWTITAPRRLSLAPRPRNPGPLRSRRARGSLRPRRDAALRLWLSPSEAVGWFARARRRPCDRKTLRLEKSPLLSFGHQPPLPPPAPGRSGARAAGEDVIRPLCADIFRTGAHPRRLTRPVRPSA